MGVTEFILVAVGVVVFLLGYLLPAKKKDMDEEVQMISEDEIRRLIAGETEKVKDRIADIVDEAVSYSIEKTERAMERLSNEKIMAINEYSDTVLEEINKNHKEVVFLYDMLNDKHDNLMSTINEATVASDEIKQALKETETAAQEAAGRVGDVLRSVDEASGRINDVLRTADDAVKGVWDAQNAARVAREAAQEAIRIASEATGGVKGHAAAPQGGQAVQPARTAQRPPQRAQRPATAQRPAQPSNAAGRAAVAAGAKPAAAGAAVRTSVKNEPAQEVWITAADLKKEAVSPAPAPERKPAAGTEFKPIAPKKVEVIRQPEEEARPEQGPGRPTEAGQAAGRRPGPGKDAEGSAAKPVEESTPAVDIQFASGPDNGRNSNERILELHKAGKSNMAIAKELGLGLGEVKLVIDLFEGM